MMSFFSYFKLNKILLMMKININKDSFIKIINQIKKLLKKNKIIYVYILISNFYKIKTNNTVNNPKALT
jgi:hypothetical protein